MPAFPIQRRFSVPAALVCFFLQGCASYTSATRAGLDAFEHRDYAAADEIYKKADEDGVDQLVYLFDRATVRYEAGRYKDSIKDLILADQLSEIKDYTSLATEVATVITNERITSYKGEEFEHVLVSLYLALNFAALRDDEKAAIASRQVNRKLERLRDDSKRHYGLNAFAQYLAALIFEREGNWNNAYIGYKKTLEIAPSFTRLKRDLVKGAIYQDWDSDLSKWKKNLGVDEAEIKAARKDLKKKGSVVLLFQNGFAPEKIVSPSWHELPEYRARYNKHKSARLYLDGEEVARTEVLYDVEKVAIENLKEKYALLIAKRLAGVVAREVIGNQLDKKAEGLGSILKIAMFAASQPDLRSWLTLPKEFQVARADVEPGKYRASLRMERSSGELDAEKDLGEVVVKRVGDIAFLSYRSLND
ncbi:MAG TPA: hypothetical protein VIH99_04505 [Bdellovibrionota bacterium]|jgi:hypothetical protein